MPSLDRPNAPKRLPSGVLDNVHFFKRYGESPNQPSPYGLSSQHTSSPSPISPKTLQAQRRAAGTSSPSHLRLYSDPSPPSFFEPGRIITSSALAFVAPGVKRHSSGAGRQRSQESSVSEPSSARSSISVRARKLLKIPPLGIARSATRDGNPPREANKGFHWHREISGHRVEIRIGKKTSPKEIVKSSKSKKSTSTPPSNESPAFMFKPSGKASKVLGSAYQPPPKVNDQSATTVGARDPTSAPFTPSPQESLVVKTTRRLGIKRGLSESTIHLSSRTKTGDMLERTSSRLRLIVTKESQHSSSRSTSSKESTVLMANASKWQRISGEFMNSDSIKTGGSASSSWSSVLQVKAPLATPNSQEMYTGADQQQYFRVEMTDPSGPNFLPSEARRINTPPVSRSSKARGFFFDYKPPEVDESEAFKTRVSRRATSEDQESELGGSRTRRVSTSEWYNVQLDAIEGHDDRARFVAEVPDHLPNSLLCPQHPKSKSGGKGICPAHGRTETESSTSTVGPGPRGSEVHDIQFQR